MVSLFLLITLNIINYSPIGWLASGAKIAYLRLPLILGATALLLVWRGAQLTGICAKNYDVALFALWTLLGSAGSAEPQRALLYASWLTTSLLYMLLYVLLWQSPKELLRHSSKVLAVAYALPLALGVTSMRSYAAGDVRLSGAMDIDQVHSWSAVIVVASLLVYNALGDRGQKRDILRRPLVIGLAIGVSVVDVALSGTRAAALGMVIVLLGYLLSGTATVWKRLGVGIVLVVGVFVASTYIHSATLDRYRDLATPSEISRSDYLRLELWQANIDQGLKHPVFGGGLLSSVQASTSAGGDIPAGMSAHGTYIEILSETGVVGALLFFLIVARSLLLTLRQERLRQYRWHIALLLLGPATVSVFEANLTPGQALFFPLWLAILMPRAVFLPYARTKRRRKLSVAAQLESPEH